MSPFGRPWRLAGMVLVASTASACGGLTLNGLPLGWRAASPEPTPAAVATVSPQGPSVARITPAGVAARRQAGEALVLVDVRSAEAHAAERIDGALHADWADLLAARVALPRGPLIVLYCTCARDQAALGAALALREQRYESVWVLDGGLAAWRAAGLPVATGPHAVASPTRPLP